MRGGRAAADTERSEVSTRLGVLSAERNSCGVFLGAERNSSWGFLGAERNSSWGFLGAERNSCGDFLGAERNSSWGFIWGGAERGFLVGAAKFGSFLKLRIRVGQLMSHMVLFWSFFGPLPGVIWFSIGGFPGDARRPQGFFYPLPRALGLFRAGVARGFYRGRESPGRR